MGMRAIVIGFLGLWLSGCASAKMVESWHAAEPVQPFTNVVVLAMVPPQDTALREQLENRMSELLCGIGYYTRSAQEGYGADAFCNLCREEILTKMKKEGVEAVVTVSLVGIAKQPAKKQIAQVAEVNLFDYQKSTTEHLMALGYNAPDRMYYWETNLYRVSDQKLLYSGKTEIEGRVSPEQFANEYGPLVVNDMLQSGVLQMH